MEDNGGGRTWLVDGSPTSGFENFCPGQPDFVNPSIAAYRYLSFFSQGQICWDDSDKALYRFGHICEKVEGGCNNTYLLVFFGSSL